jgi:hypothetical protein
MEGENVCLLLRFNWQRILFLFQPFGECEPEEVIVVSTQPQAGDSAVFFGNIKLLELIKIQVIPNRFRMI